VKAILLISKGSERFKKEN